MNPTLPDNGNVDKMKQREYFKQQHQLRTMTKSSTVLSADDMIENLLSRKEIFQKKKDTTPHYQKPQSKMDPVWLIEGNEPAIYRKVWEQVCTANGLADTPTLSNILLGSGLGTDTLGYIWSLTNVTVSGALTRIELYRTLALVALAQKGYSFTNLLVLNQFHEAPIPRLDLRPTVQVIQQTASTPSSGPSSLSGSTPVVTQATQAQQPIQQVPTVTETLSLIDTLTEPLVPSLINTTPSSSTLSVLSATDLNKLSTVTSEHQQNTLTIIEDDEFDDFKSADIFNTEFLTVLDVKDKSGNKENISNEDVFKNNTPTFSLAVDQKTLLDDFSSLTFETEEERNVVETNNANNINKEPTPLTSSRLEEALREDLTLAPVTLSSMSCSQPVESDRYNALRQLAAGIDVPTTSESVQEDLYDDYGDFITASHPSPTPDSTVSSLTSSLPVAPSSLIQSDLQEKCLEACVQVLREANDLFKSIDDPKVLAEVVSDDRGKKYLEEIVEVQRVGHRILSSKVVQSDDCELSKQLESLCKSLEPFTKSFENTHMEEEKGAKCGLCHCEIGPAHVKYGINQFHAPCANLFLHITGELLPLTPVT